MTNVGVGDASTSPKCFAFVFGMASGHINPSFPIARALVKLGHRVHYLSREQMREPVEDTGAAFHSDIENEPELYSGRDPGMFAAIDDLKEEHGMQHDSMIVAAFKLEEVIHEMMLPGLIRWLRKVGAQAVVYCPMINKEGALAGKVCGIPRIALLTTAGPGSLATCLHAMLGAQGLTPDDLREMRRAHPPCGERIDGLNAKYGLSLTVDSAYKPVGRMESVILSTVTLVTSCEDLQDPVPPELARAYEDAKVRFVSVGPLLDAEGACRAAGHKFRFNEGEEERQQHEDADKAEQPDPLALTREAHAAGRKVILMSMGTVITGDSEDYGWDRPLLLVALGPQPKALGELKAPPNAVCLPIMPQVDVLKAGADLFLTHCGQNSFMEGLSAGVPLVACPGFADQPVNAQKAVDIGVGLQVERRVPEEGQETAAAAAYREEVAAALRLVLDGQHFRDAAARCAEQLRNAGGVPRAVALVVEAASEHVAGNELAGAKAAMPEGCQGTVFHLAGA
eukprot:CAMPEP_0171237504 /NCGR_PEP_ID=MMETSP0790-20130122/42999_1 /TAXON_ID=2925 /ORGANISM="Alexandrium catenella, Strain OF101" /LENGTH=509 /DNA_ID=CAMNT_0011703855 /DNA_START=102 /DNA_END=1631 /DNA_ORIENTATION=+